MRSRAAAAYIRVMPGTGATDAAQFYTGLVADAYAALKSTTFAAQRYVQFVGECGEPALEIGCGDGDPLLDLRAAGLEVDGLDSSADMIQRCRVRAARRGLAVRLHTQTMEEMETGRRYRSIYLAGPTVTLLPDDDAALRALERIRAHLSDDGTALIPLWIPAPTTATDLGAGRCAPRQGCGCTWRIPHRRRIRSSRWC